jgi:hypothetical protein
MVDEGHNNLTSDEEESQLADENRVMGELQESARSQTEPDGIKDKMSEQDKRLDRIERLIERSLARKRSYEETCYDDAEYENDDLDREDHEGGQEQDIDAEPNHDEAGEWLTDDEDEERGGDIHKDIADFIDKRCTTRLGKEKLKKKWDRHKKPKNVKYMGEVKINNAVYRKISFGAKKRDAECRRIQSLIARAVTATAKVAGKVLDIQRSTPGKVKGAQEYATNMFEDIFDALTLGCQASYLLNVKRVGFEHTENVEFFYSYLAPDEVLPLICVAWAEAALNTC